MADTQIATPGTDLGPLSSYIPGPGTHIHNSRICASILGPVSSIAPPKNSGPVKRLTKITAAAPAEKGRVAVLPPTLANTIAETGVQGKRREIMPEVGSTVLCKVTRITPRQASVAILVVGETVLEGEWAGVIRVQDVRATEKDRVKVGESFRPGDIVRASVISLGDQSSYYLSTASNELGVIMATSEAGNTMYPVNWKEYKDPETGVTELRKVAKPF